MPPTPPAPQHRAVLHLHPLPGFKALIIRAASARQQNINDYCLAAIQKALDADLGPENAIPKPFTPTQLTPDAPSSPS